MNVKVGDLAILIKSFHGKNTGRICTVQEFIGTVTYPDVTLHNVWGVKFPHPIEIERLGSDGKMYPHIACLASVCDEWLRPVSGIPDDDVVDDLVNLEREREDV